MIIFLLENYCITKSAKKHYYSFLVNLVTEKTMLFPFRSCMLQADSEKLRQAWIKAVQTSIATAYREKGDESEVSKQYCNTR